MPQFQSVIVPLSMSPADAELLKYAALVVQLGATREVLFAHVVTPAWSDEPAAASGELRDRMVEAVAKHFGPPPEGVTIEYHVLEGARIDRIVEFSVQRKANLILLGHRKARSGRRSLSQRLAMVTPCSVWLVPEGSPLTIDRILAPVDFSDHSADGLSLATALARLRGSEDCEALHVFFDPSTIRYDERVDEIRGRERKAFDEFLSEVNTHGIAVESTFVESSQVTEAILAHVRRADNDLIVMNTRGRSRAAAILLGSVTAQTMAESPVPVLAVKHFGAHLNLFEALVSSRFWNRPNPKTN